MKEHWPDPLTSEPDIDQLQEWEDEGLCQSTDGCDGIELDGKCEHGYPSWFVYMGLI